MHAALKAKRKRSDSHPCHFSQADLAEMGRVRDRWLDYNDPLDCISVDLIQQATHDALRGAYAQLQWLWEQLEPADPILATCVERRLGALKRIPWDLRKKDGLNDAEDALADAQLRTLQDFANAIENLEEGIAALAQASFRHYRRLQLLETEGGVLRLNITDNWNWCRDGYRGEWRWNPAATFGLTRGEELPVPEESIITRLCPRPIDQPAMMLCLDRKNAKAQWLVFNGRYGVPPLFAIMPNGIDARTRSQYIQFATQCISNAAGVLPAGSDVKTVNPGSTGPDTFSRLIEVSNQEMVLRATGGLMTMLTAPGAGTNTETGSSHQDAFDDLAAAEAEEIAAVLHEGLFAPVLGQWHPGQPQLVEFVMRRPDSDNASGTISNVAALASAGYRASAGQVSELTGLELVDAGSAAPATPLPGSGSPSANAPWAALHSARRRYAPAMHYPPARETFERAINNKLAALRPAPERKEASPPLTPEELDVLQSLAQGRLDKGTLQKDAATAYAALSRAVGYSGIGIEDLPATEAEHASNSGAPEGHECHATKRRCPYEDAPEGVEPSLEAEQTRHSKSDNKVSHKRWENAVLTNEEAKPILRAYKVEKMREAQARAKQVLPKNVATPLKDVPKAVITGSDIKEMLAPKAVYASIRNGVMPETHVEAVLRTPDLIAQSQEVSRRKGGKKDKVVIKRGKEIAVKDPIAEIIEVEASFTGGDRKNYTARYSVQKYKQSKMLPKIYFLECRKRN